MSILKTRALILKVIHFGDSSSVVHFYTEKHGKVAAIAKGARRLKSPFRGYLEPFACLEIIYYNKPTRDIQTLSKIEKLQIFGGDTTDWQFTIYGSVVLETLDKLTTHQPDEAVFQLAVATLNYMSEHPNLLRSALVKFLLQLAELAGYRIDLWSCAICHRAVEQSFFDEARALLLCADCSHPLPKRLPLDSSELQFLRHLQNSDWKTTLPAAPHFQENAFLEQMLVHYLIYHHDINAHLKSLDILINMITPHPLEKQP